MDRQELMNLATRVKNASSKEERIAELLRAAPESTLNRYGLSHYSGWAGPMLAITGAFALGAGIGAGVALLFAPSSGDDLRDKLRKRAKRLGEDVKDVRHKAEEAAINARDRMYGDDVESNVPPTTARF